METINEIKKTAFAHGFEYMTYCIDKGENKNVLIKKDPESSTTYKIIFREDPDDGIIKNVAFVMSIATTYGTICAHQEYDMITMFGMVYHECWFDNVTNILCQQIKEYFYNKFK